MSEFPLQKNGKIIAYNEEKEEIPIKILEMGLLPQTRFRILHQAPFDGPLYVEFGQEKSILALGKEQAECIWVDFD